MSYLNVDRKWPHLIIHRISLQQIRFLKRVRPTGGRTTRGIYPSL